VCAELANGQSGAAVLSELSAYHDTRWAPMSQRVHLVRAASNVRSDLLLTELAEAVVSPSGATHG
jgi:hypothetical protein